MKLTFEGIKDQEAWKFSRCIFPDSMASSISCAHGTSSQTIVHLSRLTVLIILSGVTPLKRTAFDADIRLPNQCILAPV